MNAPQLGRYQPVYRSDRTNEFSETIQEVWKELSGHAKNSNFASILGRSFSGNSQNNEILSKQQIIQEELKEGLGLSNLRFELVDSSLLSRNLLIAAYADLHPSGQPTILIDKQWFKSATEESIRQVFLQEIGHAINSSLNDTQLPSNEPFDEGAYFAAQLLSSAPQQSTPSQFNYDDIFSVNIDGTEVTVRGATTNTETLGTIQRSDLETRSIESRVTSRANLSSTSGDKLRSGIHILFDAYTPRYQLDGANGPIELVNKKGNTYSDASTASWNALAATENSDGSGFQVLQGTGNKAGSFYVWSTDANGVIQKGPAGNPLHKRLTSAGSSCSPPISIKIPLHGASRAKDSCLDQWYRSMAQWPIELVNKKDTLPTPPCLLECSSTSENSDDS